MNVKKRIQMIMLLEKMEKNPQYSKSLGLKDRTVYNMGKMEQKKKQTVS